MPSGNSISLAVAAGAALATWVVVYAALRGVLGAAVDEAQASIAKDGFGGTAALLGLIPIGVSFAPAALVGVLVAIGVGRVLGDGW